jgi:transcriptional regulator with XRE-family HTH domain
MMSLLYHTRKIAHAVRSNSSQHTARVPAPNVGQHGALPKIPPPSKEAFGKRLARIRKEKGFTQVELAEKLGSIQTIISDYERGKSRPHADMITSIAIALDISADELLGLPSSHAAKTPLPNRRILRRVQLIERLPKRDQDALMRTIDAFLLKAS